MGGDDKELGGIGASRPAADRATPEQSPQAVSALRGGIADAAEVIKPPRRAIVNQPSVFLAGSIDMGKAVNWQEALTTALAHLPVAVLNPRRDDWDASWVQDISNPQFREQVEWELDHLDACDAIAMYFDPNGPAPISLLELGLYAASGKLIVCCPEGYWRRGNVQIICDRYGIPLVETIDQLAALTAQAIEARSGETRQGLDPKDESAVSREADAPNHSDQNISDVLIEALEDARGRVEWMLGQAENAMSVTAGCATTHGDPGGGLEEANRYASDIGINCQMLADKLDDALRQAKGGEG